MITVRLEVSIHDTFRYMPQLPCEMQISVCFGDKIIGAANRIVISHPQLYQKVRLTFHWRVVKINT